MTRSICDECSPEGWSLNAPEGIASVYWVDEDGNEVDVDPYDDPIEHPELTKMCFRECPECYNTWEYAIE